MTLFKYREVVVRGLRERCGTFALTSGVFRVTTYIDENLQYELPETQKFVIAHEVYHASRHHGLIALLLFPARPVLLPVLEAMADRWAVKQVGKKAAKVALYRIYGLAQGWRTWWLHGHTARARAERAGAL